MPDLAAEGNDDTVNLIVEGRLRRYDCSQLTDMPHEHHAVQEAFNRARVTLDDVDGFEVHDYFTPSEYPAIDHIGLTEPGQSWKAIENGGISIGEACRSTPAAG